MLLPALLHYRADVRKSNTTARLVLPDHNTTARQFVIKHYRSGTGRLGRAGKNAFDYRHGTANALIYLEFTWTV